MDVKTHINFDVEKNGHNYVFSMPVGGTLGEAYDAAYEVLEKIMAMSKEAADRAKRQENKEEEKDGKE